jgi:hypothetical protein
MWRLTGAGSRRDVETGYFQSTVVGNDATIVVSELSANGIFADYYPLNPTSEDVRLVRRHLSPCGVYPVDPVPGGQTQVLCLESQAGERRWVFPRVPRVTTTIALPPADVVYVDYYHELRQSLDAAVPSAVRADTIVLANLSDLMASDDVPRPTFPVSVVQVACPDSVSAGEAAEFAGRLRSVLAAPMAVVTLGHRGAVFAVAGGTHEVRALEAVRGSILGAGAVFSAQLILASVQTGLSDPQLPQRVVDATAHRLSCVGPCVR